MTRVEITINDLVAAGGGPTTNTVTSIDQASGMYIDATNTFDMMLVVENGSTTTAYDVYVLPGINPPSVCSAVGTLTEEIAAGEFEAILIESARHVQANGQIYVDFEASMTGNVAAYRFPQSV